MQDNVVVKDHRLVQFLFPFRSVIWDDSGKVFDFHALKGKCASLLAASGVHPKTAQSIMRHSDINLTMNAYTHAQRAGSQSDKKSAGSIAVQ